MGNGRQLTTVFRLRASGAPSQPAYERVDEAGGAAAADRILIEGRCRWGRFGSPETLRVMGDACR
jgi:hypothetical protein